MIYFSRYSLAHDKLIFSIFDILFQLFVTSHISLTITFSQIFFSLLPSTHIPFTNLITSIYSFLKICLNFSIYILSFCVLLKLLLFYSFILIAYFVLSNYYYHIRQSIILIKNSKNYCGYFWHASYICTKFPSTDRIYWIQSRK